MPFAVNNPVTSTSSTVVPADTGTDRQRFGTETSYRALTIIILISISTVQTNGNILYCRLK